MIRAYLLYTGADGHSHFKRGRISEGALVQADHTLFKETAANSSFDWHNDPIPQYVITLTGILEFSTKTGETFIIEPGDILLATDHTGSGHKWKLLNDQPWKRVYVIYKENEDTHFIADEYQ